MKKYLFIVAITALSQLSIFSQVLDPVKWNFTSRQISGDTYELKYEATIESGWHMYGLNIAPGGPVRTSINYNDSASFKFISEVKLSKEPEVKFDPTFEMDVELFGHRIRFMQRVQLIASGNKRIYV